MPLFKNAVDGRTINVSGTDVEARYAADTMWTLVTEPDLPEGEPDDSWKNDQIKAWAAAHDVDLGGATNKGDMLAAIAASTEN